MLSRFLYVPFIILSLVILYVAWEYDPAYAPYMIPLVVIMALIYSFSPQIDWWWGQKYPPEMEPAMRQVLTTRHAFYNRLPVKEKKRFRDRVGLYRMAIEFMPQGMESVPEDVKAAVAACAVYVTFGKKDFLLHPFENVIIYPHPFPSPQYPEEWHSSEIFKEDGAILFSTDHLMHSFLSPSQYYPTGIHEYAKVFITLNPDAPYPVYGPEHWEVFSRVCKFSKEAIHKWIGLKDIPMQAVGMTLFLSYSNAFLQALPEAYDRYVQILEFDPLHV
jgi:hypothetical protein